MIDRKKVSDLLCKIYSIQSSHLDVTGVIAKQYYCKALWRELFGDSEPYPIWMKSWGDDKTGKESQ